MTTNGDKSKMATDTVHEYDDLDNYAVDDFDDPFRSPPPPDARDGSTNKRKKTEVLGLDEEVEVAKRARVPRVKLDETRLLSENGIPKLRKRAADLKLKGRGHEFSDAARILSFYQFWLDDLFPKAKFLDGLAMVEKAGHKKQIAYKRMEWINEGKPTPWGLNDIEENKKEQLNLESDHITPTLAQPLATAQQPWTPRDIPDEGDIHGASPPRLVEHRMQPTLATGTPDDDDLANLMAEAETVKWPPTLPQNDTEKGASIDNFADEEAAMAEMDGLW
ncbi:chromosome segregation in meiosis protein 3 [Colletotrichum truncatum]|uniref:Chromosome segregation in meiosis protein 3 n=1 Tax=Colletotrichum truncatum TaxID=5467 RepID=A0ACC3Z189_COLTU|nr:chromosome segregation in meiosis protein 3 [Colletotrichum truncatum]KAF6800380.1 chromosome segregation in meiosis protein 3 [Colletotrichum truncatum]